VCEVKDESTWIGFASTIAGIIGGVVLGAIADGVKRVKGLLILLYFCGTCMYLTTLSYTHSFVCLTLHCSDMFIFVLMTNPIVSFGWFALATSPHEYISSSVAQVYIACALGNLFITATVALFYEAAVEITFPVGMHHTSPYPHMNDYIIAYNMMIQVR
jgi:hypothetical protein